MFRKLLCISFLLFYTCSLSAQKSELYAAYTLLLSDLKNKKIVQKDVQKLLKGHPTLSFKFMAFDDKIIEDKDDIVWITTMNELPGSEPIKDEFIELYGKGLTDKDLQNLKSPIAGILVQAFYKHTNWQQTDFELSKLISSLGATYNATIIDEETREFFNPIEFKKLRVENWQNTIPKLKNHITAHFYPEDENCRFVTLGMAKYGLPDIVFNNLPCNVDERIYSLADLITQTLIEQNSTLVPRQFEVNLGGIKHIESKNFFTSNLEDNAQGACLINWEISESKEADPDNMLIEIVSGIDKNGNQLDNPIKIIDAVFGKHVITKQEALTMASQAAINKIPEIKEQFNNDFNEEESLIIKANFESSDGEKTEQMWMQVTSWEDEHITGILLNQPELESDFNIGDKVVVTESALYDYAIKQGEKTIIESETNKIHENWKDK